MLPRGRRTASGIRDACACVLRKKRPGMSSADLKFVLLSGLRLARALATVHHGVQRHAGHKSHGDMHGLSARARSGDVPDFQPTGRAAAEA